MWLYTLMSFSTLTRSLGHAPFRLAFLRITVARPSRVRFHSTHADAGSLASDVYTNPSRVPDASVSSTPADLTSAHREILDSSLRVDQVGEVAADYIYRGQLAILKNDPSCGPVIQVR
jgi:RecB family exonuclease